MFRWYTNLTIVCLGLVLAAGCSTNVEPVDSETSGATVESAGTGGGSAVDTHEARLVEVKSLEEAYAASPDDEALKARLVASKYEYGQTLMDDAQVPPREKYRPALQAFNEVLALDPNHAEAAERKQAIEQIYRQMGMPIPG